MCRRILIYFLFLIFSLCLTCCGNKARVLEIDRSNLDLGFNATYNTSKYWEFCKFIISEDKRYYPGFIRFGVVADSDEFHHFKVMNTRENPNYFRLGLFDDDVLVQMNSVELKEPTDSRRLYDAISDQNLDILKFVVLRDNKEILIEMPASKKVCENSTPAKA